MVLPLHFVSLLIHDPGGEGGEGMAATYRRKKESDTWHFCTNCSNWPTSGYVEQYTKPTTGELCNECQGKKKADNCK